MPGKPYSKDQKSTALAATCGGTTNEASTISGVPAPTIRRWVADLKAMDDSELEALIFDKKRTISGLWAIIGVDALEFAQELRAVGNAKGFQSAMVAAGICSTKLEALGQPKTVQDASPTSPSLLREIPGLPTDTKP